MLDFPLVEFSCLDLILIAPSINCLTRLRQKLNSRQKLAIFI